MPRERQAGVELERDQLCAKDSRRGLGQASHASWGHQAKARSGAVASGVYHPCPEPGPAASLSPTSWDCAMSVTPDRGPGSAQSARRLRLLDDTALWKPSAHPAILTSPCSTQQVSWESHGSRAGVSTSSSFRTPGPCSSPCGFLALAAWTGVGGNGQARPHRSSLAGAPSASAASQGRRRHVGPARAASAQPLLLTPPLPSLAWSPRFLTLPGALPPRACRLGH